MKKAKLNMNKKLPSTTETWWIDKFLDRHFGIWYYYYYANWHTKDKRKTYKVYRFRLFKKEFELPIRLFCRKMK